MSLIVRADLLEFHFQLLSAANTVIWVHSELGTLVVIILIVLVIVLVLVLILVLRLLVLVLVTSTGKIQLAFSTSTGVEAPPGYIGTCICSTKLLQHQLQGDAIQSVAL